MSLNNNSFILSESEILIFEANHFAKVREIYFNYLQRVIRDNFKKCCETNVSEDLVEQISSTLEQPVLLTCMRKEIYQRLMTDMISQIKRLTEEGVMHVKIKMMLRRILDNKTDLEKQTDRLCSFVNFLCKDDSIVDKKENKDFIFPKKCSMNEVFKSVEPVNMGQIPDSAENTDCIADIISILENNNSNCLSNMNDQSYFNSKSKEEKVVKPKGKQTLWKHEKIIQMHYMLMLLSQKSEEEKLKNEMIFLNLFGEDSDSDESSKEDYRKSCLERISALVVKYLMPHYHENRIVGRNVFKKLGYLISEKILHVTDYPEEQFIRHFVAKCFRNNKAYKREEDVLYMKML